MCLVIGQSTTWVGLLVLVGLVLLDVMIVVRLVVGRSLLLLLMPSLFFLF